MIYIGDDPVKDGSLAKRVGIPFGWYTHSPGTSMNTFPKGSFSFSDWSLLGNFLERRSVMEMLQGDLPLPEILASFQ